VEDLEVDLAELDPAALGQVHRRDTGRDGKRREQWLRVDEHFAIERVNGDAGFFAGLAIVRPGLHSRIVAHVVPVAVSGHDQFQLPAVLLEDAAQPGNRGNRRVDRDCLVRA
jgi:hypothetical protein